MNHKHQGRKSSYVQYEIIKRRLKKPISTFTSITVWKNCGENLISQLAPRILKFYTLILLKTMTKLLKIYVYGIDTVLVIYVVYV